MNKIDLDRVRRGFVVVKIEGYPRGQVRHGAIEDAISDLQRDPSALCGRYRGVKNYASFGDQRYDGTTGTEPTHGHIVFRVTAVSREPESVKERDIADAIYALECARDFGIAEVAGVPGNLYDIVRKLESAELYVADTMAAIAVANVEKHAP